MKKQINNSNKCFRLILSILLAAFVCVITGCATSTPNPLVGWKPDFSRQTDQAIVNDYQDYIQKLTSNKEQFVISINWFKDGTGQHAIEILMGVNGSVWRHVLIYDNENRRIKVIKEKTGGYQS